MSQPPQLLAYFLMPAPMRSLRVLPMDDTVHISQLETEAQQTTHTSDPKHQVLCLTSSEGLAFIISTRIFFDLDGMETTAPIPWQSWGPSNTRIFPHPYKCAMHISGNRVLRAFPVDHMSDTGRTSKEHILHMMDFSPLAVTNRRGLGRVVKEPSTIDFAEFTGRSESGKSLMTSLPYVEVVSDRRLSDLRRVWIDKDRIYLFKVVRDLEDNFESATLEVINP
ncbi:hypothetical protein DFH29DRAFT_1015285 [Suillus ampliporus]|nr:hypothetical protein DFH29DRAFT_1015285 [Suillus ampliporus]